MLIEMLEKRNDLLQQGHRNDDTMDLLIASAVYSKDWTDIIQEFKNCKTVKEGVDTAEHLEEVYREFATDDHRRKSRVKYVEKYHTYGDGFALDKRCNLYDFTFSE